MIKSALALHHTGFPLVLAAPSGAGKTSIAHRLGELRPDIDFSISCTTRQPRAGERNGVDYHFVNEAGFEEMIAAGDLMEWARVHGHLYGTPRSNLEEARVRRHLLLLDIDVQGSRQVKRAVPEAVSIFILPPDAEELVRRLTGRGSEEPAVRQRRLAAARDELRSAGEFDYVVVNDNLDRAVAEVNTILDAEMARASRLENLPHRIGDLVTGLENSLGPVVDGYQ
ncbi:MAG: guanylate kinase [Gemmatimonadota bacterium]|nr:guanylate kinase [Gemmatimonadota bacterium]